MFSMEYECNPDSYKELLVDETSKKFFQELPNFRVTYQTWYSETKALIKQLLPDRSDDLVRHYQKPKPRKDITSENYRIEDYLQGLSVTKDTSGVTETIVNTSAAIPHFRQQVAILKAATTRFDSKLFDIKQLVQADIFDSEIDAARELLKNGFLRAAGAVSGVVLEKHLGEVCTNRNLKSKRKNPTINDFNELLKGNSVIDVPNWRQIQRLGDLRNLCDHPKGREPTKDEIDELISGTDKFIHTLY